MEHPLVTTPRREALADQLEELIALGEEIARNAVDAISLMGEDRHQDALDTVSLTHYPIAQAAESWRLLMRAFADNGLKPGEAPEQSDEDRQATQDTLNRSARAAFAPRYEAADRSQQG